MRSIVVLCLSMTLSAIATAQSAATQREDAATSGVPRSNVLESASKLIERAIADGELLGAVVLVARGREILLHEAHGHRDVDRKLPMQRDSLFRMASNTKAVTAAAVLALVDDGKLELTAAAAKFLPGFANGEAADITVEHLLTHTSGLRIPTLFVQPLMEPSPEHPKAPSLVLEASRIGAVGPKFEPGTSYAYSNPGYNAAAAIVEVVAQQPFAEFCEQRFYAPLQMRDTCHHESVADAKRMSQVVRAAAPGEWRVVWQPGGAPTVPFVRGSGGLISTAADFHRFCRLWLDGGQVGEVRVLKEDSVAAAVRNRIPRIEKASYGLGWVPAADGTFSHGGSDGTWVWCDPHRDLVGLVLTQTQGGDRLDAICRRFRGLVETAVPLPGDRGGK
ncbi:MAG: serine hydrolase domain-containing protein [Planctomycetota bacterium]